MLFRSGKGANKVEAADATSMTITSPILVLNGSTKTIALGEAEFQDSLIFSENGSDVNELVIAQSGTNDYTISNMVQDKDIIFNLKPGGSATEIARFDGSASSLLMAGTNKVEFNVASNSISSNGDGSVFSVASGGELKLDVNTIEMSNGTDYAMTMAKNLAAEVLKSDQPSKPVWTLENSSAAAQNGSILEFKKVATQDDGVMGSIRSVTGDGAFAQIDFKGEGATNSQTGSMVFKIGRAHV